jgi:hypothetical protein
MTEDITGITVSTCPDLSHYPPLFQLKSSEVFIKSPEVSIKSSGLFLYLFPTKQKKLRAFCNVFPSKHVHLPDFEPKSKYYFLLFCLMLAPDKCWVSCCNRASLPGKLIALRFKNAHSSSCKQEQINFLVIFVYENHYFRLYCIC